MEWRQKVLKYTDSYKSQSAYNSRTDYICKYYYVHKLDFYIIHIDFHILLAAFAHILDR